LQVVMRPPEGVGIETCSENAIAGHPSASVVRLNGKRVRRETVDMNLIVLDELSAVEPVLARALDQVVMVTHLIGYRRFTVADADRTHSSTMAVGDPATAIEKDVVMQIERALGVPDHAAPGLRRAVVVIDRDPRNLRISQREKQVVES